MKLKTYKTMMAEKTGKAVKRPRDYIGHSGLQLFAEEPEGGDGGGDPGGDGGEGSGGSGGEKNPEGGEKPPRTYNDAEVDRIVAKHRTQWEKQHAKDLEKAKEEARKYERMSKEQREAADKKKAEEEAAAKDARIRELEQQIAMDALRKTVAADIEAMPEGISASQDALDLVVTGDADAANANVKKLVGIILADRKAQEEKRATGRTPKSYRNNSDGDMTEIQKRIAKYN